MFHFAKQVVNEIGAISCRKICPYSIQRDKKRQLTGHAKPNAAKRFSVPREKNAQD
jgi:hypothetical protein